MLAHAARVGVCVQFPKQPMWQHGCPHRAGQKKGLGYMVTGADLTARLLLSWVVVTREASAILRCDRRVMRSLHVSTKLRPK